MPSKSQPDDTIVIRAPAGTKARWVRAARGGKLAEWVIARVGEADQGPRPLAAIDGDQIIELAYLQDELDGIESQADARAAVADGRASEIIERLRSLGPVSVVWLASHTVEPLP